jgi:UDP-GlcNAc:undecaprenyl-phosphate GlcNAc-1-phosphate transferase
VALVGTADDIWELPAGVKLLGQAGSALIPVLAGVRVDTFTLPFLGHVDLGNGSGPVTLIGIVAVMNVVNFTDGVDGLAAGVCTIAAATLAVIALSLDKACLGTAATCTGAGVLAAITAGAAFGFLYHNFHPASIFMGDAGSNLLGLLLACVAIQGTIKTAAIVALFFPLAVLAVPILDGAFVILKRLKYRRRIYEADRWHLHHRLANIGFSQRRTVLYLYGWTLALAGLALALRFVPYSDNHGHFHLGWTLVMVAFGLVAAGASLYLVYVLEILKFTRFRRQEILRETREGLSDEEIEREIEREIETGEWEPVRPDR